MDDTTIVEPGANAEAVLSVVRLRNRIAEEIGHDPRWRPFRNFN
jgi:hypothetical protein